MRIRTTIFALAARLDRLAGAGVGDRRMRRLFQRLRAEASDMQVEFGRAVVVSRTRSDSDMFDITTKVDVDGTLTCRGDQFLRFEARIGEPANARTTTNFERFQAAALKAALGWDAAKSRGVLRGMSSDASEYLAASRERGDVYVAGKPKSTCPAA